MTTPAGKSLLARLRRLRAAACRIEQLYGAGQLTSTDVASVYEGLFLRCITGVESYLDDLFHAVVLRRVAYPSHRDVCPRVSVSTRAILDDTLRQGRHYTSWLPYKRTADLAKSYLRGGRPFTQLSQATESNLKNWLVIRHAIAHASDTALRRFEQKVLNNAVLPPSQRTPVGYLRSQARINPAATRFEIILDGVITMIKELEP